MRLELPQLKYADENGNQVELRYSVTPADGEPMSLIFGSGDAYVEDIEVNGVKGLYKRVKENNLAVIIGNLQEVQWLERQGDRMVLYRLSTSSSTLTREQLLAFAAQVN